MTVKRNHAHTAVCMLSKIRFQFEHISQCTNWHWSLPLLPHPTHAHGHMDTHTYIQTCMHTTTTTYIMPWTLVNSLQANTKTDCQAWTVLTQVHIMQRPFNAHTQTCRYTLRAHSHTHWTVELPTKRRWRAVPKGMNTWTYSGLPIKGTGLDESICPLYGGVLNSESIITTP